MGNGASRTGRALEGGGSELQRYWPGTEALLAQLPVYAERLVTLERACEAYLVYCHTCRKTAKAALRSMRACERRLCPPKAPVLAPGEGGGRRTTSHQRSRAHPPSLSTSHTHPPHHTPGMEPVQLLLERDMVQAAAFLAHLKTISCRKLQVLVGELRTRTQTTREALRFKSQALLVAMQAAQKCMAGMHLVSPGASPGAPGNATPLLLTSIPSSPTTTTTTSFPGDPWRQHVDLYADLKHIQREEEAFRAWMVRFHESFVAFHAGALAELEAIMQDFVVAKHFHHGECAVAAEGLLQGAEEPGAAGGSRLHVALAKLAGPELMVPPPPGAASPAAQTTADMFAALSLRLNEQWVKEGVIYLHRPPAFLSRARQEPVHVLLTTAGHLHGFTVPGKGGPTPAAAGHGSPPSDDYWAAAKERWSLALGAPATRITRGPVLTDFAVEVAERGGAHKEYAFRTLSERDCQEWVEEMERVRHSLVPDGPPLPEALVVRPVASVGEAAPERAEAVPSDPPAGGGGQGEGEEHPKEEEVEKASAGA
jgi:hypothetical protein